MTTDIKPKNLTMSQLRDANIPEDYWACDFSNYEGPRAALDVAVRYLQNLDEMLDEGLGLLFAGPYGAGKTTLAYVVLKYLTRARWTTTATSLGEVVENIQRSWKQHEDDTYESNFLSRCREVEFLLLDDLSKEHSGRSGFVETTLDNLIRHRAQHRQPTFITTNLTRDELTGTYGDGVMSLLEGKLIPIVVKSADHRATVQKARIREVLKT